MSDQIKEIANNKKARFEYEILETFEAGLVLRGTEVKSLRHGKANISDAYAKIKDGEVYIHQMNISLYEQGNRFNHDPLDVRKLLLHKKEIRRLTGKLAEKGLTLVPLKLYFNEQGRAKLLIGVGKGKKSFDKRETEKNRDWNREKGRILKEGGRG